MMCTREKGYDCEHLEGDPIVCSDVAWLANGVCVNPNFQPTTQPTKSDVLHDLCVLRQSLDTVEVRSSSLLVPTISFNGLTSLASFPEAPNGSIKRAHPVGMMFHSSSELTSRHPPESTFAIRAFYVKLAVPMRLTDAGPPDQRRGG